MVLRCFTDNPHQYAPSYPERSLPKARRHIPHHTHQHDPIPSFHTSHSFPPSSPSLITRPTPYIPTPLMPSLPPLVHPQINPHSFTHPNCPHPPCHCRCPTDEPRLLLPQSPCLTPLVRRPCHPSPPFQKHDPLPQCSPTPPSSSHPPPSTSLSYIFIYLPYTKIPI